MKANAIEREEPGNKFDDLDWKIQFITDSHPREQRTELDVLVENTSMREVDEHLRERFPFTLEVTNITYTQLVNIRDSYLPEASNIGGLHNGLPYDAKHIPMYFIYFDPPTAEMAANILYLIPLIDEETGNLRIGGRTIDKSAVLVKTIYEFLRDNIELRVLVDELHNRLHKRIPPIPS
jgi:hypothetical protein